MRILLTFLLLASLACAGDLDSTKISIRPDRRSYDPAEEFDPALLSKNVHEYLVGSVLNSTWSIYKMGYIDAKEGKELRDFGTPKQGGWDSGNIILYKLGAERWRLEQKSKETEPRSQIDNFVVDPYFGE